MLAFYTERFKNIVKDSWVWPYIYWIKLQVDFYSWILQRKPVPPPHLYKQMTVKEFAREYSLSCLIETGTYLGEMIDAVKDIFSNIYSIELGFDLYERAKTRFSSYNHIKILQGDSSVVLDNLMKSIDEPCLFWLDAHYSEGITAKGTKDSPILKELDIILQHPQISDHVILIDDARCFTGDQDYPAISLIQQWAHDAGLCTFEVFHDIIRICR